MALVKCEPTRNAVPFSRAISSIFDEFFTHSPLVNLELPAMSIRPSVDIIEEEDRILLKADMPGLEKNDVKVVVNDGLLTIEGSRDETRQENHKGYARTERFMGAFVRSFNLPTWADGSKVVADYKNGVLTISIPKTEQGRPKEVEVKVS